jgi:hypothetical protein
MEWDGGRTGKLKIIGKKGGIYDFTCKIHCGTDNLVTTSVNKK